MPPVLDLTQENKAIGLRIRPTMDGPETDLVNMFIARYLLKLSNLKRSYALFAEPLLDTGFPDIVIVGFNPSIFRRWNRTRDDLTIPDFKVVQYLYATGEADEETVKNMLGFSRNKISQSLDRLLEAGLIRLSKTKILPYRLSTVFGVRSIVSIEAKMKNWDSAFKQAEINKWFASESYVLSPINRPQRKILIRSKSLGIGIYSMPNGGPANKLIPSRRGTLPTSYASWLFNEWVGRNLNM